MIEFNNVYFKYPKFELNDLNFKINDGEIVAITGNNASGKTTILNLMAGIIRPKKGKVLVSNKRPQIGKNLGMVFQNPDNQIIFSTVEDDINFTLKSQKVPKEQWPERVRDALEKVHLSGFEKHETMSLSAGQKQRLAIANMLAIKPNILLFDEASAYLDQAARKDLFKLFLELKPQGITLVFATNLIDEIVYADKVMVVVNGKITAFEEREKLIKDLSYFKDAGLVVPLKIELMSRLNLPNLRFDDEILAEVDRRLK